MAGTEGLTMANFKQNRPAASADIAPTAINNVAFN
jgi:hypothetical protein